MRENLRERFFKRFSDARRRTLEIYALADEAVLHRSPGFGFRPILWHLAHLGAFEEYWLSMKIAGANPLNATFQIIFDPIKTPRESSKNLPSKTEMLAYLENVRENVWRVLETADFDSQNDLLRDGYIFDLVLQHELQHQETLAYLFHLLPLGEIQIPDSRFQIPDSKAQNPHFKNSSFILHPSSFVEIGAKNQEFVYDNEMPAHEKFVPAFRLDRFLTTNAEFAEFVAADGYARRELWSDEGWVFREKENWSAPLYWRKVENDWLIRNFSDEKSLTDAADFPVYGVSFCEAEAYAKFRGKRLPNEFELERAATFEAEPTPENCNFDFHFWNATPVNFFPKTNDGAADLRGNLWEWTTSRFAPYPGFEPFPYPEYSAEWFDGDHRVLRGGSWATSPEILRPTFRNFFRRGFRIAFAGIRLAADV